MSSGGVNLVEYLGTNVLQVRDHFLSDMLMGLCSTQLVSNGVLSCWYIESTYCYCILVQWVYLEGWEFLTRIICTIVFYMHDSFLFLFFFILDFVTIIWLWNMQFWECSTRSRTLHLRQMMVLARGGTLALELICDTLFKRQPDASVYSLKRTDVLPEIDYVARHGVILLFRDLSNLGRGWKTAQ